MDSDVLNPQKPVVVDPEVRSYVYSLVTAVSSIDEAQPSLLFGQTDSV